MNNKCWHVIFTVTRCGPSRSSPHSLTLAAAAIKDTIWTGCWKPSKLHKSLSSYWCSTCISSRTWRDQRDSRWRMWLVITTLCTGVRQLPWRSKCSRSASRFKLRALGTSSSAALACSRWMASRSLAGLRRLCVIRRRRDITLLMACDAACVGRECACGARH